MKILALELSSAERTVAVWDSAGECLGVAAESRARHTRVFALTMQALAAAGLPREAIEGVAVGLGPGSYTGIRMAIAAAQGWHAARPVTLWGVSSFAVMAAGLWRAGRRGAIYLAADAQRGEAYGAGYELADASWREQIPLQLLSQAAVRTCAGPATPVMGPDVEEWFGDGENYYPAAEDLARLALTQGREYAPEELAPIYLRAARFAKAPPARKIEGL